MTYQKVPRQSTPYNSPSQGQPIPPGMQAGPGQFMPPPMVAAPRPRTWRERWMNRFGMNTNVPLRGGELTIPDWITGRAVIFFFVAMIACWVAFGYVPTFELWFVSALSVVLFFFGGSAMSKSWSHAGEKRFLRNVFIAGFLVRFVWVLYCYFLFNPEYHGNTYGDTADVDWYVPFAKDLTKWLSGESHLINPNTKNTPMSLMQIIDYHGSAIDDVGYPMWLGFVYLIVGVENDVFVPFLLKCILGAFCAISIYRVAQRHFGEGVARMAAIFVAINPNMIYWCGTMFKEVEMVFLVCVAVDNFDKVLNSGKSLTFLNLLPGMLAAVALFFFRSALGILMLLAVFAHILMASQRVMSMGKKVLAGVLVGTILLVGMGDRIRTQSEKLIEAAQSDRQNVNMEWRSNREGGNSFAKYAGAAVFAPLIFTIPFPTFNQANEDQLLQIQLSGGSYIKNIFSFFVILVMIMLLISGEWRRHVFILAYTVGYHVVLVMSAFAQSGRFHMPVWPMIMLFAAYGIQVAKGNAKVRKWLPIVLVLEVFICLAWNWFKLKGRGMI